MARRFELAINSPPPDYRVRYADPVTVSSMKALPLRTYATSLTDDELILFDVLFCGATTFRLLRRELFEQQWNRSSHNLTDEGLNTTLQRLVATNMLMPEQDRGQVYYQMTPIGGKLWESERLPDWNRYAVDRYNETRTGKPYVTIIATTSDARDDFWTVGRETGFFMHTAGRIRRSAIKNYDLIPWKYFPRLYVLVGVLDAWSGPMDLNDHESRRTWWRNVRENEKFRASVA